MLIENKQILNGRKYKNGIFIMKEDLFVKLLFLNFESPD